MKRLTALFILFFPIWLSAQAPKAFHSQGVIYEHDIEAVAKMAEHPYFHLYRKDLDRYFTEINATFSIGYQLDDAIGRRDPAADLLKKRYLGKLRKTQKTQRAVQNIYADALSDAISRDDPELFALLVENPMEPMQKRSLRKRVLAYYERRRSDLTIAAAEAMRKEAKLEEASMAFIEQEIQAYEEQLRVLAEAEARRIRKMTAEKRRYNVIVSTKKTEEGYDFYAENFNAYNVTVTLDLANVKNFEISKAVPLHFELMSKERRRVLSLKQADKSRRASFTSSFGWVMGLSSAKHDESVLYRVPFAKGYRAEVSQGFNGASSHKGLSRYAIDFACPIGTAVHAARSGRVIATQSVHDKGGFARKYGTFANYVIIEHADLTHGNYYHLKKGGVAVKVGDAVEAGDLIGYSGNTGYSSGPHLHFSVSKVEPGKQQRQMTLPFRLKTKTQLVKVPKRGDLYSVGGFVP